jgi:hypothetical protein
MSLLAVVRLLSERSFTGRSGKGKHIKHTNGEDTKMRTSNNNNTQKRTFKQYLSETIWACGAGVMAAHWPPGSTNKNPRSSV